MKTIIVQRTEVDKISILDFLTAFQRKTDTVDTYSSSFETTKQLNDIYIIPVIL